MSLNTFFSRLANRLWSDHEMLLLVRPADKPLDEALHKPCAGEFRPVTEQNINDCAAFEDAARYVPVYREMLQRGDVVHFGYIDGQCVFRHCMQTSGSFTYEGCPVRTLATGEVYTTYGFCAPAARGKGLLAESLYQFFLSHFHDTAYTLVAPENVSSLRSCYRNGYEIRSRIVVKCRFLRRTLTETSLAPTEANALWPQ